MTSSDQPIPITINGNRIDASNEDVPSTVFSLNAADSNYITLQTYSPLTGDQKQDLKNQKVQLLQYVSNLTYLCRYEPTELQRIKEIPYVRHVAEYDRRFKTDSFLKESLRPAAGERSSITLNVQLHDHLDQNLEQAKSELAQRTGVPESDIGIDGNSLAITIEPQNLSSIEAVDSVKSIHEEVPTALCNDVACQIMHVGPISGHNIYTGKSQVVAVADTGFDKGSLHDVHPAFTGRVKQLIAIGRTASNKTDDPHGHGTHVSGSVLGNGSSDSMGGTIQGTAPDAQLIMQSLLTEDKKGLETRALASLFETANTSGARIHTNSWGPDWKQVPRQLPYGPEGTTVDTFAFEHPEFVILYAAGNDGREKSASGAQIGSFASSKNCVTVGATESSRPSVNFVFKADKLDLNDPMAVATFSSRGPTIEGRIKPDVVAPGAPILSTKSRVKGVASTFGFSKDPLWMFDSGTSMSTPLVAGCAAVLRQSLIDTERLGNPSAALIKAMLVNGAVDLQGSHGAVPMKAAPNPIQGFGRVNLENSLIAPNDSSKEGFSDGMSIKQGQTAQAVTVSIPPAGSGPSGTKTMLRTTLAYTDSSGELLQSDLNLSVVAADGSRRNGNMGTGTGFDTDNNVERVVWESPPVGNVQIIVNCVRTTTVTDQPYALVWKVVQTPVST